MKYEELLHRCFRCGWCKFTGDYSEVNCPSYRKFRFDTFAPGGRMWLIRAWLNGDIKNSERFQEILFSCATCGSCVDHCIFPFKEDLVNIFIAAREEIVNEGHIPVLVKNYFRNIYTYGNPYKEPSKERGAWAKNIQIDSYNGQEYLFYAGCVGSYDERGKKVAQAVCKVLVTSGISIGILGEHEICDGNEVRALGETGLFNYLAEENIKLFNKLGIKKIITLDPHAYYTFNKNYPELGGTFKVFHYTQIVASLIKTGKLVFNKPYNVKVTYHDPCYLGRHSLEYNAPRQILNSIPGIELIEIKRSKKDAFCCGGGGGNFFTDILGGGEYSPNRIRIREAMETGASIVAVACPQCAKMLDDGIKSENLDERMEVMDIAEIIMKTTI